jgi:hypothetical protein
LSVAEILPGWGDFSVLFVVAFLLLFPVAVGVYDQQDKNDRAAHEQNDQQGLVAPDIV